MPIDQLLSFLTQYCQDGSEAAFQKGYQWFYQTLSPAIQQASEQLSEEVKLLSEVWLITGEVHELLQAPKQAITCYELAIYFNPYATDNYRWLALVQEQIGQYVAALENIELALKYTHEGEDLMEDRQRIQDCMVYDKIPDYKEGDLLWELTELLAAGSFEQVIKQIESQGNKDVELLRCLYRAYGGLQQKADVQAIRQMMIDLEMEVELGEVDEFYQF